MRPDIVRGIVTGIASVLLGSVAVGGPLPVAAQSPAATEPPQIVVSSAILGAVVSDLVGDGAMVAVLMGNGVDPHDWAPSARDVEAIHAADLVVVNGLGLEAGLDPVLGEVASPVFRAGEHVGHVRVQDDGSGHVADDAAGEVHGTLDPHFWVDPLSMRDVVVALGPVVQGLGIDVRLRLPDLVGRLEALDAEVRSVLDVVPPERRKLVTGHESMGYFADRYGFQLVGAVIPGLSSLGEVSASQLAAIVAAIREQGVPVIFTELGTPQGVVDAIASEAGVRVVQLPSHALPADGSYGSFVRDIAVAIAGALG